MYIKVLSNCCEEALKGEMHFKPLAFLFCSHLMYQTAYVSPLQALPELPCFHLPSAFAGMKFVLILFFIDCLKSNCHTQTMLNMDIMKSRHKMHLSVEIKFIMLGKNAFKCVIGKEPV